MILNWTLSLSGSIEEEDNDAQRAAVEKFVKGLSGVQSAQYTTNRQEYVNLLAPEETS